jgi:hypothetical protein
MSATPLDFTGWVPSAEHEARRQARLSEVHRRLYSGNLVKSLEQQEMIQQAASESAARWHEVTRQQRKAAQN